MFDPSFFSFGNGLFYNPITDSVFTPESAPASTGKVKGRDYSLSDYENLKYEIGNQTNILGVDHRASFSKNQDEIIDDMAKQLASYGVSSLKDLTQNVYTVEENDPNYFGDGEPPTVTVEKKDVINSKTGEVIPLNKLNNSAGSGFTWYNIDFVDGQAVPYAWKEATGAGALGDQIQSIVAIPPVAAALTAVTAGALLPGAKEIATSILPDAATKYAINTTANALANAGATATVVSAATGDVGTGLKAGATTLLSAGINELKGQGMDALEDLTGLDLSQPSTGSLLDTGMGDTTDQTFVSAPTPVTDMPTVTVTAPPSLLDTALAPVVNTLLPDTTQTVTVTAPQEENVIPSIPAVLQPETPTVTVIGEKPTTDLVSPIIPGLIDAGTVEVIGSRIPTVEVIGTQPTTTDLVAPVIPGLLDTITVTSPPTVTVTGTPEDDLGSVLTGTTDLTPVMETSETVTPTVTVTATPPTVVDAVAPVVTTTALPETPPDTPPETPETPFTPVIPNIPVELQQEAQRMGYVPYGSVSYEPLLSLLAPQLMTLPYASAYRRGLL